MENATEKDAMISGWALQNKLLLGIILLIAFLLAVVIFAAMNANPGWWSNYHKSIVRGTDTPEEENVLLIAENINYSEIFKTDRFAGKYAQFIDAEVIN